MPKPSIRAENFPGFPKQCFTFFRQLAKNNERDWFNPRKSEFEEFCKGPMEGLVAALSDRLRKTAVEYVPPDPKKALYRIYRDTRFAKDKTPYKTNVSALFQRAGYARNKGPSFYIQVNHEYVGIGGGVYMPEPEELKAVRQALLKDLTGFKKVAESKKIEALLGEVRGDRAKKLPKGFEQTPASHAEYIKLRQYFFWTELPAKLALEKSLVKVLSERMEAMHPMCEWLHEALMTAARDGDEEHRIKRPAPMF